VLLQSSMIAKRNRHITFYSCTVCRKNAGVQYFRRCVIMPDGAAIALDFEMLPPEKVPPERPGTSDRMLHAGHALAAAALLAGRCHMPSNEAPSMSPKPPAWLLRRSCLQMRQLC